MSTHYEGLDHEFADDAEVEAKVDAAIAKGECPNCGEKLTAFPMKEIDKSAPEGTLYHQCECGFWATS